MVDSRWTDAFILVLMVLLALWINSQFGQLTGRTSEAFVASAYLSMALVALIVMVGAKSNVAFFDFRGFEKPLNALWPFILAGGFVGFIITTQGKLILAKVLTNPGAIMIDNPLLGYAFVIVLAPFVEEYFFRGVLFPSITKFFSERGRSTIIAIALAAAISSALFSAFHVVASGGNESILMGEFIFGLLQCGMVLVARSIAPAIASHLLRNLVVTFGYLIGG